MDKWNDFLTSRWIRSSDLLLLTKSAKNFSLVKIPLFFVYKKDSLRALKVMLNTDILSLYYALISFFYYLSLDLNVGGSSSNPSQVRIFLQVQFATTIPLGISGIGIGSSDNTILNWGLKSLFNDKDFYLGSTILSNHGHSTSRHVQCIGIDHILA